MVLPHGGARLVLLGPDPLNYHFDADGAPDSIDASKEKAAFGFDEPAKERDYGYNLSMFMPQAQSLGFKGTFVAIGWQRPDQVSEVLATDRSGMATSWIKRFANGGLLIQLPVPKHGVVDMARYADAVDLAASRAAAGRL